MSLSRVYVKDPALDEWWGRQKEFVVDGTGTNSYWRQAAAQTIRQVLRDTAGKPPEEQLKAIDAAYPFGGREQWPYKCWLIERKAARIALGLVKEG